MRVLLFVSLPLEPFNSFVKDGTAGAKLNKIMEALKPETAYFTSMHGGRGGVFAVELADPSQIPALAEPWFLTFQAKVEFHVVMSPEDLKKAGLDKIGKQWT
jgi:hypothetical protein